MKTMYIMRGVPGSGKSTVAKSLAETSNGEIFSTDDFWWNDGKYNFNITKLGEAHRWNQNRVYEYLLQADGADVLIDNTNIKRGDYTPYTMLADQFGYEVILVHSNTDIQTCKDRNAKRPEDRKIPEEVIDKMASNFEPDPKDFKVHDL